MQWHFLGGANSERGSRGIFNRGGEYSTHMKGEIEPVLALVESV
jgi:hypothetical protein